MLCKVPRVVVFSLFVLSSASALAQTEIASISFEEVPGGTNLSVTGGTPIELQADTNVTGDFAATGEVESDTGFRFPDGSVQVTAGAAGTGVTANQGLYSNTIPEMTPPNAYTEICIKTGDVIFEVKNAGEPTAGGACVPGDTGWIIERFERDAGATALWTSARMECLKNGMRLPEPFEWQFACENSGQAATNDMDDDWEWVTNSADRFFNGNEAFLASSAMGNGSCRQGTSGSITFSNGQPTARVFRCAR